MCNCLKCWAYKWDGEDYCLIVGEEIQGWPDYRQIADCQELKNYEAWRKDQPN